MDPDRERFLIRMLTDHAPRFAGPHAAWNLGPSSAVRYTFEGYVAPDGGTNEEWNWMGAYLGAHPAILQRPPVTDAELTRRAQTAARQAQEVSNAAFGHFQAGRYEQALAFIDLADQLEPRNPRWDAIRDAIRRRMAAPEPTDT